MNKFFRNTKLAGLTKRAFDEANVGTPEELEAAIAMMQEQEFERQAAEAAAKATQAAPVAPVAPERKVDRSFYDEFLKAKETGMRMGREGVSKAKEIGAATKAKAEELGKLGLAKAKGAYDATSAKAAELQAKLSEFAKANKNKLIGAGIIAALAGLGYGGYKYYQKRKKNKKQQVADAVAAAAQATV